MLRSLLVGGAAVLATAAVLVQAASHAPQTFGIGWSQATLTPTEVEFFRHTVSSTAQVGVMHHFWITGDPNCVDTSIWNYYVDGERNASVSFIPSLAAGSGFNDESAPWATAYFGKQAKTGGWFHNFRVPFGKTISVTGRTNNGGGSCGFYVIVRGSEDAPFSVGGFTLPTSARVSLQKIENESHKPLELVNLIQVPKGKAGLVLATTLAIVSSQNINFLEGCYHTYTGSQDPVKDFPGTVIATGTEDYFTSAYYFDAGQFRSEISGDTHMSQDGSVVHFSAYRVHDSDPLFFRDGFTLQWRVGDTDDPATGLKCNILGGTPHGDPQPSTITSYAWVYTWPSTQ